MAQKLILPIDDCQLNAGYKTAKYRQEWGFGHYGVDLIEPRKYRQVKACGSGIVVAAGMDGAVSSQRLGNCIVIIYRDVLLPYGGRKDLACRMFHLEKLYCKAGDSVTAGTVVGEYGNTGSHSTGAHLHLEFDTDTNYPQHAYGVGSGGRVIKCGTVDSTIDPCDVFWLGEGQRFTSPAQWIAEGWVAQQSLDLPPAAGENQQLAEMEKENRRLNNILEEIKKLIG